MPETSEQSKCFVHGDAHEHQKRKVRENVCRDLPANYRDERDGESYCVIHYGNEEKKEAFKAIYLERTRVGDFNFQWAYFPETFFLADKEIEYDVDFSYAEFAQDFHLIKNVFIGAVAFCGTVFNKSVSIEGVEFWANSTFQKAHFKDIFSIRETKFHKKADFHNVNFQQIAYISLNQYLDEAYFAWCRFRKDVDFDRNEFAGEATFMSAHFFDEVTFNRSIFKKAARFDRVVFEKNAGFREVIFECISVFEGSVFKNSADFTEAEFHDFAHLEDVTFAYGNSSPDENYGGYFERCRFNGYVSFDSSKFRFASLFSSEFAKTIYGRHIEVSENANLEGCDFAGEVLLTGSTFHKKLSLRFSRFQNSLIFNRDDTHTVSIGLLDIQHSDIDDPSKVYFHTVRLLPSWFVNTNSRQFIFSACRWKSEDGYEIKASEEITNLKARGINDPNKLLTQTCWQLADNFEESKGFVDASLFRKLAFEAERLQRKNDIKEWSGTLGKVFMEEAACGSLLKATKNRVSRVFALVNGSKRPHDFIHRAYFLLSGYGESWGRAAVWLLAILFGFAAMYYFVGSFDSTTAMTLTDSVGYSLQVMTLQRPEPRPIGLTRIMYGVETLLAPLQAALLALAIRRKFMR